MGHFAVKIRAVPAATFEADDLPFKVTIATDEGGTSQAPPDEKKVAANTPVAEGQVDGNVHVAGRMGGALEANAAVRETDSEVTAFEIRSVREGSTEVKP